MASDRNDLAQTISPAHYKFRNGIETIDYSLAVCEKLKGNEAVCVSNVIKYVSRYATKGRPEADLQKAQWYLQRLIVEFNKGREQ